MRRQRSNDSSQASARRICDCCVGESYLKELIKSGGTDGTCSYCEEESRTFSIEALAELIEQAFDAHYECTPTEPDGFEAAMQSDRESDYEWERDGEEVLWAIANAAAIKEKVAEDVLSVLSDRHYDHEAAKMGEECPFAESSYYSRKDLGCLEFAMKWSEFENGLKAEARFFSRSAQGTLDDTFAGVSDLKTSEGRPVVVTAGPESDIKFLYRARVFAAEDEDLEQALKYPWKHLGPPPMHAASAGRMNARGIAVFYGSVESATALAEVRPPVGSKVAIAKFAIERHLRLLDVNALESVATSGSIFDPQYTINAQRAKFLEILSGRISRPVMPNEEAFEYLATQAVADYLATEIKLDGVIFPSVQVGHASSNVVLFHHASRVAEIQLPHGTELSACLEWHDSDGVSPDYSVREQVPSGLAAVTPPESTPLDVTLPLSHESVDLRPPSLKIDLASITVHHIKAVTFSADAYPVGRHRTVKPESSEI
jgi:hypothetical protein